MENVFTKKNDPLIEAAKRSIADGDLLRKAESIVNEKYGVYSKKALIHEDIPSYEAEVKSVYKNLRESHDCEGTKKDKEEDKKLAKSHHMSLKQWERSDADKKHDRNCHKEEVEELDELSKETRSSYVSKAIERMRNAKKAGYTAKFAEKKSKRAEPARDEFQRRGRGLSLAGRKLDEENVAGQILGKLYERRLSEERKSKTYVATVTHGDKNSEAQMGKIKDAIKGYNKAKGTDIRYDRAGRLGKNNPNAEKYRYPGDNPAVKKLTKSKIRQGDAQRSDIYLRQRQYDMSKPDFGIKANNEHIKKILHGIRNKLAKEETQLAELSPFGAAFQAARKSGASNFSFGGKSYNTRMKGEPANSGSAFGSQLPNLRGNSANKPVPTPPSRPAISTPERSQASTIKQSGGDAPEGANSTGPKDYPDVGNVAKGKAFTNPPKEAEAPTPPTRPDNFASSKPDTFFNKGVNVADKTDMAAKGAQAASMPAVDRPNIPNPPTQATAQKAGLPPTRPAMFKEEFDLGSKSKNVKVGNANYKLV